MVDQNIRIDHVQQLHIAQHNRERWEKDLKDAYMSARVPESMKDQIQAFADKHDMSFSRAVLILIKAGFRWMHYRNRTLDEICK